MQLTARFTWVHLCRDLLQLTDGVLDSVDFIQYSFYILLNCHSEFLEKKNHSSVLIIGSKDYRLEETPSQ